MRGHHHLVMGQQWMVRGQRFLGKDVQRRASHEPLVQGPYQGRLVDDTPRAQLMSRTVGFIFLNCSVPIKPRVCGVKGTCTVMKSDSDQEVIQRDGFDPHAGSMLGGQIGVEDHHPHLQPLGPASDLRADLPEADDAQHFVP